jgi:putative ABC transport system permease protein
MRVGIGGKAAVAAASALLAVALAGAPLYVSSATTKALQVSLADACPTDAGILLNVDAAWVPDLDARANTIAHVEPPVRTLIADVALRESSSGTAPSWLVWHEGFAEQLGAGDVSDPGANGVLVPASYATDAVVRVGDELLVGTDAAAEEEALEVAGEYPDIPLQPEPAAWCGLRDLLRPDAAGDPAPPLLLTGEATFSSSLGVGSQQLWELHPDPEHLTATQARRLVRDYAALVTEVELLRGTSSGPTDDTFIANQTSPALARLVDEADGVGSTVADSVLPIRLGVIALAAALLALAALAVVRDRRTELQLRLIRGEGPRGIAVRIAEGNVIAALAGTILGVVTAIVGVRVFGPSPELEPGPLQTALITAAVGLLAGVLLVAVVGARAANATVDRAERPSRGFVAPWELIIVVLAVVSYLRIDRAAGLRLVGAAADDGDVLAQAFPFLGLAAVAAVLVRPLRWLLRRARHNGKRLGPSALLGWRRLGADPGRHAFLAGAVALGVGAVVVAGSLTATSDRMLQDKSTTFLGADLRVVTGDRPTIPPGLDGSIVSRVDAQAGEVTVQVLGVDPATLANVVRWRSDAADYPLDELLHVLEVDDMKGAPLPAIVVGGPLTTRSLTGADGVAIDITPVATADFFPGKTGVPLVVVNRNALAADEVPTSAEVWLRDPPPDATQRFADGGVLVRGSQREADVFDVGSSLAVRWSFQTLWALAALMALVVLVGELLVLAARRRAARSGWVLQHRMGAPRREELWASLLAFGLPAAVGLGIGTLAGWAVVRLTVGHLDTLDNLLPPVRTLWDLAPIGVAAGVALVVVIVGAAAARSGVAGERTEVIRDGLDP